MKISVIIPIYNMADSLEECIESIMQQTYEDYEVILVDDGSTDNSYEICKRYAEKQSNIVALHQENQGSGPARNAGIACATGDYYLFMDSDDTLATDAFQILAKRVEETQSDLYVFGYKLIYKSGDIKERAYGERRVSGDEVRADYSPYFSQVFQWGIQGAPWNKLFKATVIKTNNVEYPALRRHQDEVFISRYITHIKDVYFLEDCLYMHYANDAKLMWKKFPITYFDIMEQLYAYRKEEILPWNPDNKTIEALIYSEYINNVFRACFRLFDTSNPQSYGKRLKWYQENIYKRFEIKNYSFPVNLLGKGKCIQNRAFVFVVKHRMTWMLDLLVRMRIKVFTHS